MPPKKNKLAQSSAAPLSTAEKDKEVKQRFKRNMEELGPVLEAVMEDLEQYQEIVSSLVPDSEKFKNESMLQKSVVKKMEEALNALQEAAALTHFADGSDEDGARKKKKASD